VTRRLSLLLIAVGLAVVGACGGGSSSGSSTTTTRESSTTSASARAAYVARANAICATMNSRGKALGDPGSNATKLAVVSDETAKIIRETLQRLRALQVPAGESAAVAAMYSKVDVLVRDYAALSTRLRARDEAGTQRAVEQLRVDADTANAAANDYGLTVCGTPS
jgi:hypothetical protein